MSSPIMIPPGTQAAPRKDPSLAEAMLLGVLVGICHTVAEATLIGWYGLRINLADLALLTVFYCALGIALGAAFRLALWVLRNRVRLAGRPDAYTLFFVLMAAIYGQVGSVTAAGHAAGGRLFAVLSVLWVFLVLLVLAVTRSPDSRRRLVPGLLGLAFSAVGATTVAAQWHAMPMSSMRAGLCASLCLPPAICLGAMMLAGRRTRSAGGALRGAAFQAGCAYAGAMLLWLLLWPAHVSWHLVRAHATSSPPTTDKPNVLLLVLDTLRAQNMELFGYERKTMPFLTEFARQDCDHVATILTTAPQTLPAHASMFTGHFVYSHGAHKPFLFETDLPPGYLHALDDTHPTLAQWLSQAGYQTAGIVANYGHLGGYGIRRGFGHYDCVESDTSISRRISWLFAVRQGGRSLGSALMYRLPDRLSAASVSFTRRRPPYRRAEHIVDLAVQWLAERNATPFFLFVNIMDPHNPYLPPPQYRERFGQEPPGIQWVGFPEALHKAALYEGRPFPEQDLAYAVSQYDASIAYADDQVARLIRHLKQIECFDNTLIIITSDHGEEFWEHGSMLHGTDLYNPQTRVPLLIKLPAAAQRDAISPSPHLQFVDFLPTIAELFALEPPAGMQGTPWGRGRNYALAENYVAWGFHPKWLRELVAIESGEFKYIHSTTGEEEVYDIANDPDETKNLLGSMPEFAKRMRAIKELRDQGVREDRQRQTQEDTDEQRERLRSLGYL